MQFMLVSLFSSGASLLAAGVMTLAINSRHLFYGLSFLTRFRKMGAIYPYMVCSLTDETYSLLCTCCPPPDIDSRAADFLISLLDHFYWVAGFRPGFPGRSMDSTGFYRHRFFHDCFICCPLIRTMQSTSAPATHFNRAFLRTNLPAADRRFQLHDSCSMCLHCHASCCSAAISSLPRRRKSKMSSTVHAFALIGVVILCTH